ncbi:DinB family protein [Pedobacter sp. R-06]|uniref:DinB family protein n=1 Tax=Pedobacter sp. R-06 TaxID=3404051 RepID=UPI003CF27205
MKAIKLFILFFIVCGINSSANAQTAQDKLVKEWGRAKAYTGEYLEAMPESGYSLKPTPEMRSFAEQMLHLTDTDYIFAAAATGERNPVTGSLEKSSDLSKASITKQVLDGYDFVIACIKKTNASQLAENFKLFGKFELTREMALQKAFEHQTHQRGQTTVYLRLAGVKPPAEKLF